MLSYMYSINLVFVFRKMYVYSISIFTMHNESINSVSNLQT